MCVLIGDSCNIVTQYALTDKLSSVFISSMATYYKFNLQSFNVVFSFLHKKNSQLKFILY